MVHSVAAKDNTVYASHNGKVYRFASLKAQPTSVDVDLRQLGVVEGNLVGIGESKDVVVLNTENLERKAQHSFPKRPSSWTTAGEFLCVSDKFGDVFKAPLLEEEKAEKNEDTAILGHVSMVLALAATPTHFISSDRDEHIRVSEFPRAYVIDRFLLGHKAFVSQLVLHGEYLVSGGGDSYVLAWNWQTGEQLAKLEFEKTGVIAAVRCGGRIYFAHEHSNEVVSASFPHLRNVKTHKCSDEVHALGAGDKVYVGFSNRLAELDGESINLEGESSYDLVSEEHLRKRE